MNQTGLETFIYPITFVSVRNPFASPEERTKLVFPKDWDLSEANKLSGAKAAGRPAKPKTTTLES